MPKIKVGIPQYSSRTDTIYIPSREDWGVYYDPGEAVAHEIGHHRMGHRDTYLRGMKALSQDLEATIWAIRRRGLTEVAKEYLRFLQEEADSQGISEGEFILMLRDAVEKVEKRER
jgi:hypothetical protein